MVVKCSFFCWFIQFIILIAPHFMVSINLCFDFFISYLLHVHPTQALYQNCPRKIYHHTNYTKASKLRADEFHDITCYNNVIIIVCVSTITLTWNYCWHVLASPRPFSPSSPSCIHFLVCDKSHATVSVAIFIVHAFTVCDKSHSNRKKW